MTLRGVTSTVPGPDYCGRWDGPIGTALDCTKRHKGRPMVTVWGPSSPTICRGTLSPFPYAEVPVFTGFRHSSIRNEDTTR